jgi:hypothetical protein
VPALLAAATGSDWNAGGSIITFYFPVGLFVVIAAVLSLQFARPHAVPGRRPFKPAQLAAGGPAAAGPADAAGENAGRPAQDDRAQDDRAQDDHGPDGAAP